MELPNELTRRKGASAAFTWAISWRFALLSLALGWLFDQIPLEDVFNLIGFWPTVIVPFILMFLMYWLVAHWVLHSGFGNVKIVLLDRVQYQKIASTLNNDR
ncbi:hypothetical protein [Thiosocius teredinicola]|uniref:hypothetical protein n=1 Tax=Thiosocius teredinicola TaxID=1973002 RepID=UPI000F7A38E1